MGVESSVECVPCNYYYIALYFIMQVMDVTPKTYYWMVNINYPFLVESEEAALQYVDVATKMPGGKHIGGQFTLYHVRRPYYYFLYEFHHSIPANKAKITDFVVGKMTVETDTILPPSKATLVSIDLRLITITRAKEAAKEAAKDAIKYVLSIIESDVAGHLDVSQLITGYEHSCKLEPDLQSSSIELPEIARNQLLFSQISEMAHEKGYCVATNKSVIDPATPCVSKHHKSRPDLILYHTKHYHAYVIKSITDEDRQDEDHQDEDQDEDRILTLKAGVAENENQTGSDTLGQLLGEMEKVAGDLAFRNIADLSVSEKERAFQCIELFGLTIDVEQSMCKVYKLKMDFLKNCSTLSIGNRGLHLDEAVNRLFGALHQPELMVPSSTPQP